MRFRFLPCLGGLAIIVTSATIACSASGETPDRASGRSGNGGPAIPVTTAKVDQKSMPLVISVIGNAEAYSNVAVHPQITGQLTSVDFKEGGDIRKGEIIFTLDFRPLEAALEQAKANLMRDMAQAANAHSSPPRYQDLQARGIPSNDHADQ